MNSRSKNDQSSASPATIQPKNNDHGMNGPEHHSPYSSPAMGGIRSALMCSTSFLTYTANANAKTRQINAGSTKYQ